MTTYGVTGASGQLGKHVLDELLQKVDAGDVIAFTRDTSKLADYAAKGVTVRAMDYDKPEEIPAALSGVDRLLLISGSALGERPRQHANVINGAKEAGVGYIAYTSILDAENTPIKLGAEHLATEKTLAESGISHDILAHGWYNENYIGALKPQVEAGVITGAQGQGRISSATRADMAAADATVLVSGKGGERYNIAGDESWTMEDFAAEVSRQSGKEVKYIDMAEGDYAKSLEEHAGLPGFIAAVVANSAAATAKGALEDNSRTLSRLAGRPTTPIAETIAGALA
ncbi:SDR family oxidoreductase [Alteraurantiacibacter aquimixticola]|uniref:SDR family oxidoreductase n=1 Tax=Alteraurantiacibacter aquimixticola TaxID=2489173 RepID=A0A4T3F006_9SPHN|nr:SDR family oxidoreductase [Alteraurantiacibacter aquimixticola]TIX49512.1 SDR family oxidoreductase [Alteraurantiacibacter aquimixticola]